MKNIEYHEIPKYSGVPVVVKLWASWCQPCRKLAPEFEKIANAFDDRAEFYNVKIDDQIVWAKETFGIRSVPAIVVLEGDTQNVLCSSKSSEVLDFLATYI